MEGADDNHFGWADDVRHARVHFGIEVFKLHPHDGRPRFFVVGKHDFEQQLNNPPFGWGKFTPFNSGMITAIAAEEVFHQNEHQTRFHGHQGRPLKWTKTHHVQTGRNI
ncbi:Uncharacterised protein [Vibrio cholerae]|nr:Uncharacterised protein [Vibrio cholerae]